MRKWTKEEEKFLKKLIKRNFSTKEIAEMLSRSVYSVNYHIRKSKIYPKRKRNNNATTIVSNNIDIIKDVIQENVTNLSRAFRILSNTFKISKGTLANYWYTHTDSPMFKHNIGNCFYIHSNNNKDTNTKNK